MDPITVSPAPANIKIIQPIQFLSSTERNSPEFFTTVLSTSSPWATASPSSTQRPRLPKQQQRPALSFPEQGRPQFSARQESSPGDSELPDLTPLGVRLSLEDMVSRAEQGLEMRPIPGEPGVDYPVFSEVPVTDFNCRQQEFPGIYTDVESNCQVFHMCQPQSGELNSFLCPNGTMFSQQVLQTRSRTVELLKLVPCFSISCVTGGTT